jgi:hypothetical protein
MSRAMLHLDLEACLKVIDDGGIITVQDTDAKSGLILNASTLYDVLRRLDMFAVSDISVHHDRALENRPWEQLLQLLSPSQNGCNTRR